MVLTFAPLNTRGVFLSKSRLRLYNTIHEIHTLNSEQTKASYEAQGLKEIEAGPKLRNRRAARVSFLDDLRSTGGGRRKGGEDENR